ncbi:MAG: hypothetical protein ACHQK8_06220, partial [Bacteroidia bacterium]
MKNWFPDNFPLHFDKRLFVYLSVAFVLFTVIGTLSHEGGHYLVGKYYGLKPRINYMSTIPKPNPDGYLLFAIQKRFSYELMNDKPFPLKDFYCKIVDKKKSISFFFILGGPLQTMLTGTFGLLMLI